MWNKVWSREKTIEKNRSFSGDYVKINELNVVHTWRYMPSE